jgi:hypothetical protein
MATHAVEYVRVRNAAGTLQTNTPAVQLVLSQREEDGYRLVSSVPDTHNGDLVGVLLIFVKD